VGEVAQMGVCPRRASTGVERFPGVGSSTRASPRQSRLVSGEGVFVPWVYLGGLLSGTPSYQSSCKISANSDNSRPSYSDLPN